MTTVHLGPLVIIINQLYVTLAINSYSKNEVISCCYGTKRFITVFMKAHHWTLSKSSLVPVQSIFTFFYYYPMHA